MRKNVILLELLPNYISSVEQKKDKDGNDIYYYRHFDWDKPYCNNVHKGDEFFLINRQDVDEPGIYMHVNPINERLPIVSVLEEFLG